MRSPLKITTALLAFLAAVSAVGVSASFFYADADPEAQAQSVVAQVQNFYWDNAGALPEDSSAGENHISLIERIINSNEGLNEPSSHLNDVISQRVDLNKNTASSVAPTKGGNLKSLFNTDEMRELHFLLQFAPTNGVITEYFLYTFERAILGNKQGTLISPVYKTQIILENGIWKAAKSWKGKAETIYYDTQQGSGKDMTINPNTWVEETISTE